jgi:GrpB-like predicted nucleotidyltransferase (UPF0157 family)
MLTSEQEKWISHLGTKKVKIVPYDPKTKVIFKKVKKEIQKILGEVEVFHRGATSLGISGQGEIDLYIPVPKSSFAEYLEKLVKHFGKPGSIYPFRRARFVRYVDDIKIEIFLINKDSNDWENGLKFENYLKQNPKALKEYKKLKEDSGGSTLQEYYRKKLEFINKILDSQSCKK